MEWCWLVLGFDINARTKHDVRKLMSVVTHNYQPVDKKAK